MSEADEEMSYDPEPDLDWAREKFEKTTETNAELYEHLKEMCHRFQLENFKLRQQLSESTPDILRDLREANAELKSQVATLHQENRRLHKERDESAGQLQTLYQRLQLVLADTSEASSSLTLGKSSIQGDMRSPATVRPSRPLSLSRPSSRASLAQTDVTDASRRASVARTVTSTPPPTRPLSSFSSAPTTPLGAPFTDARELPGAGPSSSKKTHLYGGQPRMRTRVRSGDFGSPMRVPSTSSVTATNRMASLMSSPGAMSEIEGPSVHYDHDAPRHPVSPGGTSSSHAKWRIHFAKAPTTIRISSSFIAHDALSSVLTFNPDTDATLSSLGQREPNGMRMLIAAGYGFVFDPVVLENPRASYLVDWGDVNRNDAVKQYIMSCTANDRALHTFIFSAKNHRWLYLGHCEWNVTQEVGPVWPMLNSPAQRTLAGRRASQRSSANFLNRLKESELVQLIVHIQPVENTTQERELLRRLQQAVATASP